MPGQFPDFDLYEELEVSPRASEEVIQAAYRRLAQTFHPDHYKGPDSGRMTRLNVAREFLSDSLKRADYDRQRPGAQAEAQARAGLQYWPDGVIASFDIETTGLSPESDEIIQVAILYIDRDGRVLPNSWTSIVNPGRPSSPQAFAVHGITDDRAAREGISAGDAAREILIRLRAVADDHIPLVVYNAPFDLGFMHVRASRFGTVLPELIVIDPLVCDRALDARRTGSRTLGAVAAYYGCTADGLHDAQNDAAVAVAIARAIAQKYPHIGQSTLIDLHRQQSIWSRGQRGAAGWPVPDRYSVGRAQAEAQSEAPKQEPPPANQKAPSEPSKTAREASRGNGAGYRGWAVGAVVLGLLLLNTVARNGTRSDAPAPAPSAVALCSFGLGHAGRPGEGYVMQPGANRARFPMKAYGGGLCPGDMVRAWKGGVFLASVIVDGNGNWSIDIFPATEKNVSNGDRIDFTVNNVVAAQHVMFYISDLSAIPAPPGITLTP